MADNHGVVDSDDDDSSEDDELRPETKLFLQTLQSYLDCRKQMDAKYMEIDEFQLIQNRTIRNDSGGLVILRNSSSSPGDDDDDDDHHQQYKTEYQQQSCQGRVVERLEDLYQAAELTRPLFQERVIALVQTILRYCGVSDDDDEKEVHRRIQFPNLKSPERAVQKANDDYAHRSPGPVFSWLFDILRCSIILDSAEEVLACMDLLEDSGFFHIVKVSNRFQQPALTGYRDLNFHVQIRNTNTDGSDDEHDDDDDDAFSHICEIQVHHKAIQTLDVDLGTHAHYEYFRSYFAGATGSLKERLEDLQFVGDGIALNGSCLGTVLKEIDDVERLKRLAKLFEKQLCEYNWALKAWEQVLSIKEKSTEIGFSCPECTELATTYRNMGSILQEQCSLNAAMDMYGKALQSQFRIPIGSVTATGHVEVAKVYQKMGDVYYYQHQLEESMGMYQKALEIQTETLGLTEHPDVAATCQSMGNVLRNQSKREEAIAMFHRTLEIQRKCLGPQHSEVAATLRNLGLVLYDQGDLNEAMEMFQKAVEIQLKALGPEHVSVSRTFRNIGLVHYCRDELDNAMTMFDKALDIQLKALGPDNMLVATTYHNIGNVLLAQGRLEAADEFHQEAEEIAWRCDQH